MQRYYTRACNFYFGNQSKILVNKKKSIPLHQIKEISFDHVEIITRKKIRRISINQVKKLPNNLKKKINVDIKKINSKKKNFSNFKFKKIPNVLGVLNLTPDSFSDGGKYDKKNKGVRFNTPKIFGIFLKLKLEKFFFFEFIFLMSAFIFFLSYTVIS